MSIPVWNDLQPDYVIIFHYIRHWRSDHVFLLTFKSVVDLPPDWFGSVCRYHRSSLHGLLVKTKTNCGTWRPCVSTLSYHEAFSEMPIKPRSIQNINSSGHSDGVQHIYRRYYSVCRALLHHKNRFYMDYRLLYVVSLITASIMLRYPELFLILFPVRTYAR